MDVELYVTTDGSPNSTSPTTAAKRVLPMDVAACHAMIRQLLEHQQHRDRLIERLQYKLQDLLRRLYGRSSEKIDPNQLVLFRELLEALTAETPAGPTPAGEPPPPPPPPPPAATNGHGRRRLPRNLPRTRIVHDLTEAEQVCPCCGEKRRVIGQEVSEQLDYEPAKVSVIEHVRLTYACRACEQKAVSPQITTAAKPLMPIEKGLAAPGLLSYVIVSKYADHRVQGELRMR